jgi:hypothetical protein
VVISLSDLESHPVPQERKLVLLCISIFATATLKKAPVSFMKQGTLNKTKAGIKIAEALYYVLLF